MSGKVIIGDHESKRVLRLSPAGALPVAGGPAEGLESQSAFTALLQQASISTTASHNWLVRTSGAAFAFLAASDNPTADETVTIGDTVYTFVADPTSPYDVDIGGDAAGSLDNLIAAINGAAGEGTAYGTGTEAHPDVRAAAWDGDVVKVQARAAGVAGNLIALDADGDNAWTDTEGGDPATFLAGGSAGKQITLRVHGVFNGFAQTVTLFEDPTIGDDGTAVVLQNRNRTTGAPASETMLQNGPTVVAAGNQIASQAFPATVLGELATFQLEPGREYLVRLTNDDGSTRTVQANLSIVESAP